MAHRVRSALVSLIAMSVVGSGCGLLSASDPSSEDVQRLLEKWHRGLAEVKVVEVKNAVESDGVTNAYAVHYKAELRWRERVGYRPQWNSPMKGLAASLGCSYPVVNRAGEQASASAAIWGVP